MEYKLNTHKVSFVGGEDATTADSTLEGVEYGSTLSELVGYIASKDKLKDFDGWYSDEGLNTKWDFSTSTMPDEDLTLYAKWTAWDFTTSYWMAPAYKMTTGNTAAEANQTNPDYVNPETGIIKTAKEIQADVEAIKKGNANQDIIDEYTGYMTNDNYHLYTSYNGATLPSTKLNDYLEFRIIQVGEHDGDGSGLTFRQTHARSVATIIRESVHAGGGWTSCSIRASYNGGNMRSQFSDALKADIMTVNKKCETDFQTKVTTTNEDSIWLISLSELTGDTTSICDEGSQYAYYKDVVGITSSSVANPCLGQDANSRDNTVPTGAGNTYSRAWLRSVYPNYVKYGEINNTVFCSYTKTPLVAEATCNTNWSAVPAFAM